MGRFILHAANVHSGGGLTLLQGLLDSAIEMDSIQLNVDARAKLRLPTSIKQNLISPSLSSRVKAEYSLSKAASRDDRILCFGNLPPLFPCKGRVLLFLQNRYFIDRTYDDQFPYKERLKLHLNRFWFSKFLARVDAVIVQSASMKQSLLNEIPSCPPIHIRPFADMATHKKSTVVDKGQDLSRLRFIYPSSSLPHKNHGNLLKAWSLLAKEGLKPELTLTLTRQDYDLIVSKHRGIDHLPNIKLIGFVPHAEILRLYEEMDALIFPSLMESMGLPLLEARQKTMGVLASELDYVRDLVDPDECFDPNSPISIMRSVKRFAQLSYKRDSVVSCREFWDELKSL